MTEGSGQAVEIASRAVLAVTALVYLLAGAYCLVRPDALRGGLGLAPTSDAARVELMAVYGGLELGLGLFFGLCAVVMGWQTCGLTASVVTFGMLVAVRLAGALANAAFSRTTVLFLVLELALGAAAGAVLLWGLLAGRGVR